MRIWLDTDIGSDVDDALALAYVLRHPDLELAGISTVFGDIRLRGRIVEALLAIAGAPPVPLLPGMGVPLADRRHGIMFGHEGVGLLDDPDPTLRVRSEDGAEARIDALAGALAEAEPDRLVAIGPMTNLGALVGVGASLPPLTIMGGRVADVSLPGMSADITEWNWHCDPLAVQRVFQTESSGSSESSDSSGRSEPATVVPAEVTFTTRLRGDDIDRLDGGDPLLRSLAALCRQWLITQRDRFEIEQPIVALHDPLTAAVLTEPGLCTYRRIRIAVDDRAEVSEIAGPANVRVATAVDADAARDHIMNTLLSGPSPDRANR